MPDNTPAPERAPSDADRDAEIAEVLRWAQSRKEYPDTPFANTVPRVIRHIIAERDALRAQLDEAINFHSAACAERDQVKSEQGKVARERDAELELRIRAEWRCTSTEARADRAEAALANVRGWLQEIAMVDETGDYINPQSARRAESALRVIAEVLP